jgi:hypothetical protein
MALKDKDGATVASVGAPALPRAPPHAHNLQFNGKWISISHTVVAYCRHKTASLAPFFLTNWLQAPSSEPSSLACTLSLRTHHATRLTVSRSLHYRKIVQNEFYVSKPNHLYYIQCLCSVGLPPRMVPLRLRDHWRPLPGALHLYALHCAHIRYDLRRQMGCSTLNASRPPLRIGRPLVCLDPQTKLVASQFCRCCGRLPHVDVWRMDIRDVDRRPRLARHLHDLIPGGDTAMDTGLSGFDPAQPNSAQV